MAEPTPCLDEIPRLRYLAAVSAALLATRSRSRLQAIRQSTASADRQSADAIVASRRHVGR
jgi:hypothetical protein